MVVWHPRRHVLVWLRRHDSRIHGGCVTTTLFNGGANLAAGGAWHSVIDGTNLQQLGQLIEIYKNHADQRATIINLLENLSFGAPNSGQREAANNALVRCEKFDEREF